jgi:hypothetical protein
MKNINVTMLGAFLNIIYRVLDAREEVQRRLFPGFIILRY